MKRLQVIVLINILRTIFKGSSRANKFHSNELYSQCEVLIHFRTTWLPFSRDNKEQTSRCIARARERNAYKERQATIDRAEINKLYAELKSVSKVAKAMNICRNSVYRNLEKVA